MRTPVGNAVSMGAFYLPCIEASIKLHFKHSFMDLLSIEEISSLVVGMMEGNKTWMVLTSSKGVENRV